ncbi:hypothetical protein TNCV_2556851 [Trichonephila clavipes]|nr:hypothetical protein TNCV_2556851 [Trichonephila clavipes]
MIFQRLLRQLRETRLFHVTRHDAGRRRPVRSPSLEESILNVVANRSESIQELLLITYPQRKKSGIDKFWEHGGQSPLEMI